MIQNNIKNFEKKILNQDINLIPWYMKVGQRQRKILYFFQANYIHYCILYYTLYYTIYFTTQYFMLYSFLYPTASFYTYRLLTDYLLINDKHAFKHISASKMRFC